METWDKLHLNKVSEEVKGVKTLQVTVLGEVNQFKYRLHILTFKSCPLLTPQDAKN